MYKLIFFYKEEQKLLLAERAFLTIKEPRKLPK